MEWVDKMALKKTQARYLNYMKKLIIEEQAAVYKRDKLSKALRDIRREKQQWENWLANGDQ